MWPTPLNNAYPQRGIIMTVKDQTAQVFIPLAKFETDFIDSIVHLNQSLEGREVVVLFINGDRNQGVIVDLVEQSNRVYPQSGTLESTSGQVNIPNLNLTVNTIDSYVTLTDTMVGKACLVVFLDGDIQQPVIAAVKT